MKEYSRKNFIRRRGYQIKYSAVLIFAMLLGIVITGAALLGDIYSNLPAHTELDMGFDRYVLRLVFLLVYVFLTGIFLSHKVVGPLDRLKEAVDSIRIGEFDVQLKLREGDEFFELAEGISEIASNLGRAKESLPGFEEHFKKD